MATVGNNIKIKLLVFCQRKHPGQIRRNFLNENTLCVFFLPEHPDFWGNQEAFATVLGTTPRVFAASLIGYLFGEFSNSMILSKLKVKTEGKKLWMRTIGSTIVGEAFDTVIFISISFWGTMPTETLLQMMLFQYLFKVCYEIIFTPVTYAVVRKLKKIEDMDTYDTDVNYNPFAGK